MLDTEHITQLVQQNRILRSAKNCYLEQQFVGTCSVAHKAEDKDIATVSPAFAEKGNEETYDL